MHWVMNVLEEFKTREDRRAVRQNILCEVFKKSFKNGNIARATGSCCCGTRFYDNNVNARELLKLLSKNTGPATNVNDRAEGRRDSLPL